VRVVKVLTNHRDKVHDVVFSAGGLFATASYDTTVLLWRLERFGQSAGG
jgi:WD40 repeat protein